MIRIFQVLIPTSVLTLFFLDLVLVFGCYAAGSYLAPDVGGDIFLLYESGFWRVGLVVVVTMAGLYFTDLYSDLQVRSRILLMQQLFLVLGGAFISQAFFSYLNVDWSLPRRVMIIGSLLAFAVLYSIRLLFQLVLQNAVGLRRVIFLGASPTVTELTRRFELNPELGFLPIGSLASPAEHPMSANQIMKALDRATPDWIVIGKRDLIQPTWVEEFLELRFGGVQADDAATFYENTLSRVCAADLQPAEVIFGDALQPPQMLLNLQWLYSLALACFLVIIAAPLFVLLALLVRFTSAGPVLLREKRIGLNNEAFTMYRFRCAVDDRGIRRATWVGKFLQRSRLDCLPCLLNLLRGNLAVIGPAPVREEFGERLSRMIPFYPQRHAVRPGLIGLAQVSAALEPEGWHELRQLEYDLYYIKNISPSLDLFIALRSFRSAFSQDSA